MAQPTDIARHIDPETFLRRAIRASTPTSVEQLLAELPIVSEDEFTCDASNQHGGWRDGWLHWIPVGRDRGNAGRIKLANQPVNPIAERIVNGMEALIELRRALEVLDEPHVQPPESPRAAVKRYFGLPPLDEIPKLADAKERSRLWDMARALASRLRVRLLRERREGSWVFTVVIEDDGIGQVPEHLHATLLSLGSTTKGDKPYLIGLFGQGGSSAFAVSQYSWVTSRRAPRLLNGCSDGVGWSVIKHVFPKGRRDPYFAYLAIHPDGRVPMFDAAVAEMVGIDHGTRFAHIGFDFQKGGSAVTRDLFPALNHVLYNPMLPYELYASRATPDPMWGNAYRLSNLAVASTRTRRPALDKTFPPQPVTKN